MYKAKIIAYTLFVSILAFSLGYFYHRPSLVQTSPSPSPSILPTPAPDPSQEEEQYIYGQSLMNNELRAWISPTTTTQAVSKSLHFRVGTFDKDWECPYSDMSYLRNSISFACRQNPCDRYGMNILDRSSCRQPVINRRYPYDLLNRFTVSASPYEYTVDPNNLTENPIPSFTPNHTTGRGRKYQLEVIDADQDKELKYKDDYSKKYIVTYYGPKYKLPSEYIFNFDNTQNYTVTKFEITLGLYDKEDVDLQAELSLKLIDSFIDSLTSI